MQSSFCSIKNSNRANTFFPLFFPFIEIQLNLQLLLNEQFSVLAVSFQVKLTASRSTEYRPIHPFPGDYGRWNEAEYPVEKETIESTGHRGGEKKIADRKELLRRGSITRLLCLREWRKTPVMTIDGSTSNYENIDAKPHKRDFAVCTMQLLSSSSFLSSIIELFHFCRDATIFILFKAKSIPLFDINCIISFLQYSSQFHLVKFQWENKFSWENNNRATRNLQLVFTLVCLFAFLPTSIVAYKLLNDITEQRYDD